MSTKFFTNQDDNSLLKKFEGVFENVPSIKFFDILVGYFRASGYFKVRPFLDRIPKVRILVGINVDKLIKKYHEEGKLYLSNSEETKESFLRDVIKNIEDADYDEVTEKGIVQFIQDITTGKVELKAHPNKKIHAKIYIFRPENFNTHSPCEVITGSSNLTNAGLGANPESNYEFNVSLRDYQDVKFASDEFERLWDESEPILQAEAERIKNNTYLKDDFTPFELYIKMLLEYFGNRVDYDPYNIDLLLPPKYIRLKYQSDAANQGYAIMMKHNGFILADVVGLGKTIVACMIIKKFIYENGTHTKILVVVPPAIEDGWRRTVKDFELDNHFMFITNGSLHKILDKKNYYYPNPDEIDLIVADESHKFRNDYTTMYVALQEICKIPRLRVADDGDSRKKVILLSATPLNNRPQDIENQLYLFQDRRNSTLEGVCNLQEYFKPINKKYEVISKELKELDPATLEGQKKRGRLLEKLKVLFQQMRDDIVEPLVIRRTRTDIENVPEYLENIKKNKIKFPKVYKGVPKSLFYKLDDELSELFFDTISIITSIDLDKKKVDGLGYYRYRLIEYLIKEEDKGIYGDVRSISNRLSGIMKTLLIKRLESSFYAFTQSLKRFQKATNNMIKMFKDNSIFIAPDLDINQLLEEGLDYEQIEMKINEKNEATSGGVNNRRFETSAFDSQYLDLLKKDKVKVDGLVKRWKKISNDPKLEAFAEHIDKEFFKKKQNESGKLVIFTESKETAEELIGKIEEISDKKALNINAGNRKSMEKLIRDNFDANLEEEYWKDDYNIIVTTEVLAEGINLHRSNVVVNYDVPWNATRLMQRIGRVNRIGSRSDYIYVFNYYPSAHGDSQIHLVDNALRKLQAFHTAFGEDNKIFSLLEEKGEGALFGNKIVKEESEILKYLIELRDFKKNFSEEFKRIKNIPNKARCCREVSNALDSLIEDNMIDTLSESTLSYLKSENHPGIFCLITPQMKSVELNFLKAVKIFNADKNEKSIELHKLHHTQALTGVSFFKSKKTQENIQQSTKKHLSPAENKSLSNLNALLKTVGTEQKKNVLIKALEVIKMGTYASKGLPKSINDFFRINKSLLTTDKVKFTDNLFIDVLERYDLSVNETEKLSKNVQSKGIVNPQIVLSESFMSK